MADWILERLRMTGGVWEGGLSGPPDRPPPELVVTWQGRDVAEAEVRPDGDGRWRVVFRVPEAAIADGTQTVLVGPRGGPPLCAETFVFGDPLEADLRAEISMLRAELDLLKRAFRRHCAEGD